MLDMSNEQFDKVIHNNIRSNQILCNLCLPHMIEKEDGSIKYFLFPGDGNKVFWTQITVTPVGDSWQVTYARSENQVGLWKMYSVVTKIEVHVINKINNMISEITVQKARTPGFLRRLCN